MTSIHRHDEDPVSRFDRRWPAGQCALGLSTSGTTGPCAAPACPWTACFVPEPPKAPGGELQRYAQRRSR
ncbi:hypothetical protein [Amycolatopsis sp.]|uniref:hypothetical protein n=1 Tax=Amycolatopsis sp. TaxID=37632 RepID=UPI002D7FD3AA|nr:hypothetical protein [Amycolatopsis sp.]HET6709847.1 hypothetical protein [Amycolatopsis sp.]